ncbi:MAG TPA: hypothetical protein VFX65_10220 [Candidatus Limnocylindrales bacterium]|nr:hypothetical protein [Candidatus Limnocylindrales bacterium]
MTIAKPRPRIVVAAWRLLLALAWLVVALAIALGGAGIVAQWSHPPGTFARSELTYQGDLDVAPLLDDALADLAAVGTQVDRLSVLARGALAAMADDDQAPFAAALAEGSTTARAIEDASAALRTELLALPSGAGEDRLHYGIDSFARRAAMLNALDATEGLGRNWAQLTAGGLAASQLISLLTDHDLTVAAAAAEGRAADYVAALGIIAQATAMLDAAEEIRDQVANTSDVAVLDTWLSRNRRYDAALAGLYAALRDSGGVVNDAVREAYREEAAARAVLPPDTRGLVVIVADIGRGGLNQAVIAIEQARGRLSLALEALGPAEGDDS